MEEGEDSAASHARPCCRGRVARCTCDETRPPPRLRESESTPSCGSASNPCSKALAPRFSLLKLRTTYLTILNCATDSKAGVTNVNRPAAVMFPGTLIIPTIVPSSASKAAFFSFSELSSAAPASRYRWIIPQCSSVVPDVSGGFGGRSFAIGFERARGRWAEDPTEGRGGEEGRGGDMGARAAG